MSVGKNILSWIISFALMMTFTAVIPVQTEASQAVATNRLAGDSRTLTAVEISKNGWDAGSDTVILARGDLFPDALTGAVLAQAYDAPILLTNSKVLTTETALEIKRLNAKHIYLLGGTGAISSEIQTELSKDYTVHRIGGDNRYETSANIAKHLKDHNKLLTDKAVIAYGQNFPDALAISSWAAQNGVPILLSETNYLPEATVKILADLEIVETIITGGIGVISEKVEAELPQATRYGGKNRYETAIKIITELGQDVDTLYVATGSNFPDALAGSALAAKHGKAILLVGNPVDPSVASFLENNVGTINTMVALGGSGVVTPTAFDQIVKVASGIIEETPAQVVGKALESIKELNEVEANKYFSYDEFMNYDESYVATPQTDEYVKLFFNKLDYNIVSTSIIGDTAKVKAEITNTDLKLVFETYIEEVMILAFEDALQPEELQMTEEEFTLQVEQILINLLEQPDNQLITTTVEIALAKNDSSWTITMDEKLQDALMGGLVSALEEWSTVATFE